MLYSFVCDDCGVYAEAEFAEDDTKIVICPECDQVMGRDYSSILINANDRYSGYYDETLGVEVLGKNHRRYMMAKKGLEQYEPDPERMRVTQETRYIKKHAPGDEGDQRIKEMRRELKLKKAEQRTRKVRKEAERVALEEINRRRGS